jgi:hypothetical protein
MMLTAQPRVRKSQVFEDDDDQSEYELFMRTTYDANRRVLDEDLSDRENHTSMHAVNNQGARHHSKNNAVARSQTQVLTCFRSWALTVGIASTPEECTVQGKEGEKSCKDAETTGTSQAGQDDCAHETAAVSGPLVLPPQPGNDSIGDFCRHCNECFVACIHGRRLSGWEYLG